MQAIIISLKLSVISRYAFATCRIWWDTHKMIKAYCAIANESETMKWIIPGTCLIDWTRPCKWHIKLGWPTYNPWPIDPFLLLLYTYILLYSISAINNYWMLSGSSLRLRNWTNWTWCRRSYCLHTDLLIWFRGRFLTGTGLIYTFDEHMFFCHVIVITWQKTKDV